MGPVAEMFIWSNLGKNLLEMEVRTFARIKKVIWDQLVATKAEIIQSKLYFSFACLLRKITIIYRLDIFCFAVFLFCHICSLPRPFFRLSHLRKVRKRCSHSIFSFQAIILDFFWPKRCALCPCFSVAMGDYRFIWLRKRSAKTLINSSFVRFCWNFTSMKLNY